MQLRVDRITVLRGDRMVLNGVSLTADAGEAVLLKGANGTGKTTLLRAIAGYIRPAAGSIAIHGGPPDHDTHELLHFVGHQDALKPTLTVRENAQFWSSYLEGGHSENEPVTAALVRLGIDGIADAPAAYLSAGQRRRLALARLLVAKRPIWLLDEPSVSLDAASVASLADIVETHRQNGGLVIAATHLDLGFTGTRELVLQGEASGVLPA